MSFQPTTQKQWADGFDKFKRAKPEFKNGKFSVKMLEDWMTEFINLKLWEAWKLGMLEAKEIITETPDSDSLFTEILDAIDEAIK